MRLHVLIGLLVVMATACTFVNHAPTVQPPKTQLQTREFQTREFDTNDTKLIMKAVLNVLQDDGFVVKNAVVDLGLLTATKEVDLAENRATTNRASSDDYWWGVFESVFGTSGGRNRANQSRSNQEQPRFRKFKLIEVSVNVSEIGRRSKVRANFQAKILDNQGQPLDVYVIEDQKFYQEFFAKVDKGIFIQKQGF